MLRIILLVGLLGLTGRVLGQSDVFWGQTGIGSNVSVQQALQSGNGSISSAVTVVQAGSSNQLIYNEQGKGNTARFQQTGNANQLELNLIGENNRYSVDQIGNRNLLSLPDVRSNNVDVQLIQRGDGNQLIRQGTMSVGVPMRIEQTGGMKVVLTNGNL